MKVFDLETTGFSGEVDQLVEIAIVEIDEGGVVRSEWSSLVRAFPTDSHGLPSDLLTRIHGIGWSDVRSAPTLRSLAPEIMDRLDGEVLIGHNAARFDLPFLTAALKRIGVTLTASRVIDTLVRDRAIRLDRNGVKLRHTLSAACEAYQIPLIGAHRAIVDTRATATLAIAQSVTLGW